MDEHKIMSQRRALYQLRTKMLCDTWKLDTFDEGSQICPAEFDSVICWPPTSQEKTSVRPCPSFLPYKSFVNRTCGSDGSWINGSEVDYTSSCGLDETVVQVMKQTKSALEDDSSSGEKYLLKLYYECTAQALSVNVPENHCSVQFDGLLCWNYTPAGHTAKLPCPSYYPGFDASRFAYRRCMDNATWYQHPEGNNSLGWSNYTTCVDLEDLQFRQLVNTLYVGGYSVSCIALFISLIIFLSFRSLNCTRIAIHVQLFLSFAANNVMWVIWYLCVVGVPEVVQKNEAPCQLLHILLQYLMVANYMWMFCEGLHLHLALVVVFVKDEVAMRWFYFIGWALPLFITMIYSAVRYSRPEDKAHCWMDDSYASLVLTIPVLTSMVANLVFLINVVRVLLTKLHGNTANPAPVGMRKAVRATLILVPLFGLHHILIPFRPLPNEPGEMVYQVLSAIIVSMQGFCVSCLFCFANVDVIYVVKPILKRHCPLVRKWTGNADSAALGACVNTQTQSRDVCV